MIFVCYTCRTRAMMFSDSLNHDLMNVRFSDSGLLPEDFTRTSSTRDNSRIHVSVAILNPQSSGVASIVKIEARALHSLDGRSASTTLGSSLSRSRSLSPSLILHKTKLKLLDQTPLETPYPATHDHKTTHALLP